MLVVSFQYPEAFNSTERNAYLTSDFPIDTKVTLNSYNKNTSRRNACFLSSRSSNRLCFMLSHTSSQLSFPDFSFLIQPEFVGTLGNLSMHLFFTPPGRPFDIVPSQWSTFLPSATAEMIVKSTADWKKTPSPLSQLFNGSQPIIVRGSKFSQALTPPFCHFGESGMLIHRHTTNGTLVNSSTISCPQPIFNPADSLPSLLFVSVDSGLTWSPSITFLVLGPPAMLCSQNTTLFSKVDITLSFSVNIFVGDAACNPFPKPDATVPDVVGRFSHANATVQNSGGEVLMEAPVALEEGTGTALVQLHQPPVGPHVLTLNATGLKAATVPIDITHSCSWSLQLLDLPGSERMPDGEIDNHKIARLMVKLVDHFGNLVDTHQHGLKIAMNSTSVKDVSQADLVRGMATFSAILFQCQNAQYANLSFRLQPLAGTENISKYCSLLNTLLPTNSTLVAPGPCPISTVAVPSAYNCSDDPWISGVYPSSLLYDSLQSIIITGNVFWQTVSPPFCYFGEGSQQAAFHPANTPGGYLAVSRHAVIGTLLNNTAISCTLPSLNPFSLLPTALYVSLDAGSSWSHALPFMVLAHPARLCTEQQWLQAEANSSVSVSIDIFIGDPQCNGGWQDRWLNLVRNYLLAKVTVFHPNHTVIMNTNVEMAAGSGVVAVDLLKPPVGKYLLVLNATGLESTTVAVDITFSCSWALQLIELPTAKRLPYHEIDNHKLSQVRVMLVDHFGNLVDTHQHGLQIVVSSSSMDGFLSAGLENGVATFSTIFFQCQNAQVATLSFYLQIPEGTGNLSAYCHLSNMLLPIITSVPIVPGPCSPTQVAIASASNCSKCPEGATCDGTSTIIARAGFWFFNTTSANELPMFTRCQPEKYCLEGSNTTPFGSCLEHHQGVICSVCHDRFMMTSDSGCVACGSSLWAGLIFASGSLIGLAALIIIVHLGFRSVSAQAEAQEQSAHELVQSSLSECIRGAISYGQTSIAVSVIEIPWPSLTENFWAILKAGWNLSINIPLVRCLVMPTVERVMIMHALLPMACLVVLLFDQSFKVCRKRKRNAPTILHPAFSGDIDICSPYGQHYPR